MLAELLAHELHRRQGARIVHPGRTDHADGAGHLTLDGDGGQHQRTRGQGLEAVLGTDGHRQAPVEDVLDELHHDQLLLQDRQHRPDGLDRVEGRRHARRAPDEDVVGLTGGTELAQGGDGTGDDGVERRVARLGHGARVRQRAAPRAGVDMTGGVGEQFVGSVGRQVDGALLHGPVRQHDDQEREARREPHQLHRPDRGRLVAGADDDRRVVGEAGQEAARPTEEVFDLTVYVRKELSHLVTLVGAQGAGASEMVDEESVSLVGGDPSRTGVRLRQVAVAFERRHLATHGGRRHLDAGIPGDVGGADGLCRLDVLRDHGVQDGGLAVIEPGVGLGIGGPGVGRPRR